MPKLITVITFAMLASSAQAAQSCSWDRPGANAYTGDVPLAVDAYTDIHAWTREKLQVRMARREYDELVEIRRDTIIGKSGNYGNLRDMHFGAGQRCATVTRDKWEPGHVERGLVYCEDGHCLIVPTVCRNVSRVDALWSPADSARKADQLQAQPWRQDVAPVNTVPEPSSLWLVAGAMVAWAIVRMRELRLE